MDVWTPNYEDLEHNYAENFSLSGLNTDISNKFALISLICFVTKKMRKQNPDTTCYNVIMKIVEKDNVDDFYLKFLRGLSVVCNDFMQHTTEFMTFDLKTSKEIISKIREILATWLPF